MDRKALAHLLEQSTKFVDDSLTETIKLLKEYAFRLSSLSAGWWIIGRTAVDEEKLVWDLLEELVRKLKAERAHHEWYTRNFFSRGFTSSKFHLNGKERSVLMLHKVVQHISAYIAKDGSSMAKGFLQNQLSKMENGGVTDSWLHGLANILSIE